MPIIIEQFESADQEELRIDPDLYGEDTLVDFLQYHSNQAFTLRELATQTGIPLLELAAWLNQLASEDVVINKASYWTISPGYSDSWLWFVAVRWSRIVATLGTTRENGTFVTSTGLIGWFGVLPKNASINNQVLLGSIVAVGHGGSTSTSVRTVVLLVIPFDLRHVIGFPENEWPNRESVLCNGSDSNDIRQENQEGCDGDGRSDRDDDYLRFDVIEYYAVSVNVKEGNHTSRHEAGRDRRHKNMAWEIN